MKNLNRVLVACLYTLSLFPVQVKSDDKTPDLKVAELLDVSVNDSVIAVKMSQLMPYDTYTLDSPLRLVLEIPETKYSANFSKKSVDGTLVSRMRGYQYKEVPLISRVILDLKSPVDYKTSTSDDSILISLKKNDVVDVDNTKRSASRRSSKTDLLRSLPSEVVTLDFESADIKDVLRLLAETSNINIIYGPEVAGTLSIHLKQVPFDEAFRTIMNLKGLTASQLGSNIIRITTPDILTRERARAVTTTKTIPINYLKAVDVLTHLQTIMASSGRKGTITTVAETNSLVLTDTDEGISQSEILISQIDKKPKQVMIESRIVEINIDNGFDIGVQWEYAKRNPVSDGFNFTGHISESGWREGIKTTDATGDEVTVGAQTPQSGGMGVSLAGPTSSAITFGFFKSNSILNATLSALITQSKARILSSPKIVTVNGQQAKIEAIQQIPFRTATVSASGAVAEGFTNVDAGIKLDVTPTINSENRITLKVKPESSFPTEKSTSAGPIISTRKAETTIVVKDGDTLVIGGLIEDRDTKAISKVPMLGDIPILGAFFRKNSTKKLRNELLVFVTPRIIND